MRRKAINIKVGDINIGSESEITIQSMLNAKSDDVEANVRQAVELEQNGCQIIRVAIPNMQAVQLIEPLKNAVNAPMVADIHFDYRLALECVSAGIDKIRINPGNIGGEDRVKMVADACRAANVPIRIGVNAGSLEKEILSKYGAPCAEALCESALYHVSLLEKFDFHNIVLSIKSSDVATMVRAYELTAQKCDYPLHLGVTEAGTQQMGVVKSAIGIGSLLLKGIGDTIRVSLTADPVAEVIAAKNILKALGLRRESIDIISCPTCGRTKVDIITLANEAEQRLANVKKPLTVAIMGCEVNGPGEAKHADIGIAGGNGCGLLIKKGEIIRKIPGERLIDELVAEIEKM